MQLDEKKKKKPEKNCLWLQTNNFELTDRKSEGQTDFSELIGT